MVKTFDEVYSEEYTNLLLLDEISKKMERFNGPLRSFIYLGNYVLHDGLDTSIFLNPDILNELSNMVFGITCTVETMITSKYYKILTEYDRFNTREYVLHVYINPDLSNESYFYIEIKTREDNPRTVLSYDGYGIEFYI